MLSRTGVVALPSDANSPVGPLNRQCHPTCAVEHCRNVHVRLWRAEEDHVETPQLVLIDLRILHDTWRASEDLDAQNNSGQTSKTRRMNHDSQLASRCLGKFSKQHFDSISNRRARGDCMGTDSFPTTNEVRELEFDVGIDGRGAGG